MKTFSFARDLGDLVVVVQDNPKDMIIEDLNQFQIHLAQDSDMGGSLQSFDDRMSKMATFLNAGMATEALREYENSRYGVNLMFQKLNLRSRALADLVISVNNTPIGKTEEERLQACKELAGLLTEGEQDEIIQHIQKKFGSR